MRLAPGRRALDLQHRVIAVREVRTVVRQAGRNGAELQAVEEFVAALAVPPHTERFLRVLGRTVLALRLGRILALLAVRLVDVLGILAHAVLLVESHAEPGQGRNDREPLAAFEVLESGQPLLQIALGEGARSLSGIARGGGGITGRGTQNLRQTPVLGPTVQMVMDVVERDAVYVPVPPEFVL